MAEKKINSPFVPRPVVIPGQKDFDEYYIDLEIRDRVVPVDGKEGEFIVEKYVHTSKRKIEDVVNADKDNVGVENIIKQVLRTGDTSLLPVDKGTGEVLDLSHAPENLMELKQMGLDAQAAFGSLPQDLVNGMDMVSFVNSMDQAKFDQFIAAVQERMNSKEVVEDGK